MSYAIFVIWLLDKGEVEVQIEALSKFQDELNNIDQPWVSKEKCKQLAITMTGKMFPLGESKDLSIWKMIQTYFAA